jgi:GTP-binding protein EngB required for normal cell division
MLGDLDTRFKDSAGLSFSFQIVLTKMDCVPVSQLAYVIGDVSRDALTAAPTAISNIIATSAAHRGGALGIQMLREAIIESCN